MISLSDNLSQISTNTLVIGFAFLCLYSAFNAVANTSELVLNSYQSTHVDAGFGSGFGYTTLMLFNIFFALGPFVSPFLVRVLLDKLSLFVASISFALYAASFLQPNVYALYISTSISGVFTSLLWAAGFNLITVSCRTEYLEMNTTIFWLIAQFSYLFGNGVLFFTFYKVEYISDRIRYLTMSILTISAIVGTALFSLAKQPYTSENLSQRVSMGFKTSVKTVTETVRLLGDYKALLMIIPYLYTGIYQSFFMGVYGTSLGQTKKFGDDAKWLAGVSGIFVGVGQITAALLRILWSKLMFTHNRFQKSSPIFHVTIGLIAASVCNVLIYTYLPDRSPIEETEDVSIFKPSEVIAILCSFLLGFADCFYQTEIFNFIGLHFKEATPSAMAMFSFFQAIGGILVFFYTNHLSFGLRMQISIMAVGCLLSFIVFLIVISQSVYESSQEAETKPAQNNGIQFTETSSLNKNCHSNKEDISFDSDYKPNCQNIETVT